MSLFATIAAYFGAFLLFATGAMFLFWPSMAETVGLKATGPIGVAELRAIGGGFCGLALAVAAINSKDVYLAVGLMLSAIALTKSCSAIIDRPPRSQIAIGIFADAFMGTCFLISSQIG